VATIAPIQPVIASAPPIDASKFSALPEKAELKLVQVVFRHGARTPLSSSWKEAKSDWPNIKWDVCGCAYPMVPLRVTTADGQPPPPNPSDIQQTVTALEGGCHMGQLTEKGQRQAKDLGTWLRSRYVDTLGLLPPTYQDGLVAARTTNYQRTRGTLAGVLTGLWGGEDPASMEPIHVVTSNNLDEILYADTKTCPHLQIYMGMMKETSKGLVTSDPDMPWAEEEATRVLALQGWDKEGGNSKGVYWNTRWAWTDLHDVLTSMEAAGKPLPTGVTPRLKSAINRLATKEFAPFIAPAMTDTHGHAVLRLSLGVLLTTLVENMEAAAASRSTDSTAPPVMRLYSGHDSTVMPLLSALGVNVLESWPPYVSNLVFELWQLPGSESHVVRVLYNREELDIPHCPTGKYAVLAEFKEEVVGPFLLQQSDIKEMCKVPIQHLGALPTPQEA